MQWSKPFQDANGDWVVSGINRAGEGEMVSITFACHGSESRALEYYDFIRSKETTLRCE